MITTGDGSKISSDIDISLIVRHIDNPAIQNLAKAMDTLMKKVRDGYDPFQAEMEFKGQQQLMRLLVLDHAKRLK